ncbi:hypothetical protein AGMMS4957_21290 [Bacteroidia bacterium]|nr:hypothetical protein AGMMS4957_21290 [Bacteroidia bacterium]
MKKKIIFILAIVIICSCKKSTNETNYKTLDLDLPPIDINHNIDKTVFEAIDTTEFVAFWGKFRTAILEHDTASLAPMLNDGGVYGGWFLLRKYNKISYKLDKSLFMQNLYVLFTPDFLSLLKSYKIDNFLRSHWENLLWKKHERKTYQSYVRFERRQYETTLDFYPVVIYEMLCMRDSDDSENSVLQKTYLFIEQDIGTQDIIGFDLTFVKIGSKIKLYRVGFSYNYSISG